MNAEEWCKNHKNKYFQTGYMTERNKEVCYEILTEFAEFYHQSKVNNGVLDDVSNRRELLKKWWKYFDEESVAVNCDEHEREEVINHFFNCG